MEIDLIKLLTYVDLSAPWEYNSQDRVPVKPLTGPLYAGGTRRKSSLEYVLKNHVLLRYSQQGHKYI